MKILPGSALCAGESPEYGVLIRQSFPFHCKPGLDLPDKSLSQELYRIITNQGVVIRYLRDGAAEVRCHEVRVV